MSDLVLTEPQILDVSHNEDEVVLTLFLGADLDYFKGHFPGAPILAGVVQLDWAVKYARKYLAIKGDVKDIEVLKFQVVMTPELELTLTLTKKKEDKFSFSYQSNKGQHASGRVVVAS
ncbi:ApeI family dehydratase [Pseudoalteromonas pernae]|uniref:ApeI family dehydratase n=1 Tax=Pseudoalteromonas pernae TaxID=3118054 RepID=UPI003242F3D4